MRIEIESCVRLLGIQVKHLVNSSAPRRERTLSPREPNNQLGPVEAEVFKQKAEEQRANLARACSLCSIFLSQCDIKRDKLASSDNPFGPKLRWVR